MTYLCKECNFYFEKQVVNLRRFAIILAGHSFSGKKQQAIINDAIEVKMDV